MVLHSPGISDDLFSSMPAVRRTAALGASGRTRRSLLRKATRWPENSPGALNAWLLMLTTKPARWRDPLLLWQEHPPTLGTPHEGFFYPDPIGFWVEIRRWSTILVGVVEAGVKTSDALAVSALVHLGQSPELLEPTLKLLQPRVVLFLDEACWDATGWTVKATPFAIPDPHRRGVVYQGFWATNGSLVIGKSPQHPAAHQLYGTEDMARFLQAMPILDH